MMGMMGSSKGKGKGGSTSDECKKRTVVVENFYLLSNVFDIVKIDPELTLFTDIVGAENVEQRVKEAYEHAATHFGLDPDFTAIDLGDGSFANKDGWVAVPMEANFGSEVVSDSALAEKGYAGKVPPYLLDLGGVVFQRAIDTGDAFYGGNFAAQACIPPCAAAVGDFFFGMVAQRFGDDDRVRFANYSPIRANGLLQSSFLLLGTSIEEHPKPASLQGMYQLIPRANGASEFLEKLVYTIDCEPVAFRNVPGDYPSFDYFWFEGA